jgi:hypothetical protein
MCSLSSHTRPSPQKRTDAIRGIARRASVFRSDNSLISRIEAAREERARFCAHAGRVVGCIFVCTWISRQNLYQIAQSRKKTPHGMCDLAAMSSSIGRERRLYPEERDVPAILFKSLILFIVRRRGRDSNLSRFAGVSEARAGRRNPEQSRWTRNYGGQGRIRTLSTILFRQLTQTVFQTYHCMFPGPPSLHCQLASH